ncbi:MAG: uroporphyrinogen decarboxylase family protein [Anaerolineae bacterium]|nr:uroporphyrinogen decarboxylase family protein [Anaerolineae bacterium]
MRREEMTKRERICAAFGGERPDRLPLGDVFTNEAVIAHYAGVANVPAQDHVELRLTPGLQAVGRAIQRTLDLTMALMTQVPQVPRDERNEHGFVNRFERWTAWLAQRPFRSVHDMARYLERDLRGEIEPWASYALFRNGEPDVDRFRHNAAFIQSVIGDTVYCFSTPSLAFNTALTTVVGLEGFIYLLADYPDLTAEWLEMLHEREVRFLRATADPQLSPVALIYGDIAGKSGLFFPPAFLRRWLFPQLRELVGIVHEVGMYAIYHSDGNLLPVLDELSACGIDGLNPVEAHTGMTIAEVRHRQPRLVTVGGLDATWLLPFGTPEEVRAAVREAIRAGGPSLHLVLGSSTEIHQACRLENVIAYLDEARREE